MSNYCQYCGLEVRDGRRKYCGPECRDRDRAERGAVCESCGREFIRPRKRPKQNLCEKCWYKKNASSPRKKAISSAAPPERQRYTIDDALREIERVKQETGRHLTYGEIMARRYQ